MFKIVFLLIIFIILMSFAGTVLWQRNNIGVLVNSEVRQIAGESVNNQITLIATGDIIPARYINYQVSLKKDFTWPYQKTAEVLKNADITFANLESPLIKNCPLTTGGMVFCGDERNIEGLKFAGIDVVSLANNHAGNYGKEGVKNTANLLNQGGILATGIDGPVFKEIKGIKFAFLGYNDIEKRDFLSSAEEEKIKIEISQAKLKSDLVIVAFHWGTEYQSFPNQRQISLAHLAIDSGADLIIGNHPHWIQATETYNDKLIVYAHGNFIFDQFWSKKTLEGMIGKYTFSNNKLVDYELMPVQLDNNGHPSFMTGVEKERILNEIQNNSKTLKK